MPATRSAQWPSCQSPISLRIEAQPKCPRKADASSPGHGRHGQRVAPGTSQRERSGPSRVRGDQSPQSCQKQSPMPSHLCRCARNERASSQRVPRGLWQTDGALWCTFAYQFSVYRNISSSHTSRAHNARTFRQSAGLYAPHSPLHAMPHAIGNPVPHAKFIMFNVHFERADSNSAPACTIAWRLADGVLDRDECSCTHGRHRRCEKRSYCRRTSSHWAMPADQCGLASVREIGR